MNVKCPFYGFRWPERTTNLVGVGGDECALDFNEQGPCAMVAQGGVPDFRFCAVADGAKNLLAVMGARIHFVTPDSPTALSYPEWRNLVMRRSL